MTLSASWLDIRALSSPEFEGRETGTEGAKRAAEYIAQRMEEIGLFPAGDLTPTKERNTFIQSLPISRPHLTDIPRLEILGQDEQVVETLVYRKDFVEKRCQSAAAPPPKVRSSVSPPAPIPAHRGGIPTCSGKRISVTR